MKSFFMVCPESWLGFLRSPTPGNQRWGRDSRWCLPFIRIRQVVESRIERRTQFLPLPRPPPPPPCRSLQWSPSGRGADTSRTSLLTRCPSGGRYAMAVTDASASFPGCICSFFLFFYWVIAIPRIWFGHVHTAAYVARGGFSLLMRESFAFPRVGSPFAVPVLWLFHPCFSVLGLYCHVLDKEGRDWERWKTLEPVGEYLLGYQWDAIIFYPIRLFHCHSSLSYLCSACVILHLRPLIHLSSPFLIFPI